MGLAEHGDSRSHHSFRGGLEEGVVSRDEKVAINNKCLCGQEKIRVFKDCHLRANAK